jgi:predicted nucleotide-binding protein
MTKILIIENEPSDFNQLLNKIQKDDYQTIPSDDKSFNEMFGKLKSPIACSYIEDLIMKNYQDLRCIICDLRLTEKVSGDDVIDYIRNQCIIKHCPDFTKFIPIIIFSNFTDKPETKTALKVGGDCFIWKGNKEYINDVVQRQCKRFDELCQKFILKKRPEDGKPCLFIGSSSIAKDVAYEVKNKLKDVAHCDVWDESLFKDGKTTIENIETFINDYEYSVFIFNNDDKLYERNNQSVPRDNVILEYGMFLQKNTRNKTFFIVPNGFKKFDSKKDDGVHIATDLAGVCCEFYDIAEYKRNKTSAVGDACNNIKKRIQELEK